MIDFRQLRIIFMGTPDFAVSSLQKLHEAGCNIVAVVTAPDKPAGRGMELQQSAVKKYAIAQELICLQPEKLKSPEFLEQLKALQPDLQIVVAFRMLPEVVWNFPPMGTVNLHGSLLPQYRGAAPINWAIINGEKYTGVTTFKLQHEIDTGDILLSQKIDIPANMTAGMLYDEMKETGATLLLNTVIGLSTNELIPSPQNNDQPIKHAPKIFTETCQINWNNSGIEIINLVRGLSPYPAAFTFLGKLKLKVFAASFEESQHNTSPGNFETDGILFLKFACANGFVHLNDLQLEGKKRMNVADFLRGYRFDKQ
jgi:methionyl-tRNA formyltransferase